MKKTQKMWKYSLPIRLKDINDADENQQSFSFWTERGNSSHATKKEQILHINSCAGIK